MSVGATQAEEIRGRAPGAEGESRSDRAEARRQASGDSRCSKPEPKGRPPQQKEDRGRRLRPASKTQHVVPAKTLVLSTRDATASQGNANLYRALLSAWPNKQGSPTKLFTLILGPPWLGGGRRATLVRIRPPAPALLFRGTSFANPSVMWVLPRKAARV